MKNKIGIVILNYLNWKDTCELMSSLFKQTFNDYEVVIVDNASSNKSYEILNEKYAKKSNVFVLQNSLNLGFAKGNNVGISFLKKRGIERVLVVNNDVIFTDENYLLSLSELTYSKDVGAIGTKIIGADDINQNPIIDVEVGWVPSIKSLISKSVPNKYTTFFKKYILGKKQRNLKNPINTYRKEEIIIQNDNFFLHGAVIFFTENYLKYSDGFFSGTFLFFEENILSIIFRKLNLKFMYVPSLSIYHKEDQSSILAWGNDSKIKRKYARMSILNSFKVLIMNESKLVKVLTSKPNINL